MNARPALSTVLGCFVLAACSTDLDPTSGRLTISRGREADAFTATPVPARMVLTMRVGTTAPTTVADVAWPATDLDLGQLSSSSSYSFAAELRDGSGAVLLRGETPSVSGSEIGSAGLDLLVGRAGLTTRPTAGLVHEWPTARAAALGRYVFVASPDTATSELYDFAALSSLTTGTSLTRRPLSMASGDGTHVVLIDASGATNLDVFDGTSADATLGTATAADLAGGLTILGDDGAYIVGATRSGGAPTRAVVRIGNDGTITPLSLSVPRAGAAATWSPGAGLVVIGGAGDVTCEVLAAGASGFTMLGPVVSGSGGAALGLGDGTVVLVGGIDGSGAPRGSLRVPLACGATCATTAAGTAKDLASGEGFAGAAGRGLLVGSTKDGHTVALRVTSQGADLSIDDVPLRVPRSGAAAATLGDGYAAIMGGVDANGAAVLDIEVFTPL